MIRERIERLRALMAQRGIDAYLVPASDFHQSEYVGEHFKCIRFLTGFTGSAGVVAVTKEKAYLWTDGRYFVQAQKELPPEVELMKAGCPGVPSVEAYLEKVLGQEGRLGFDGRVINGRLGAEFEKRLKGRDSIVYGEDLVGLIWENRPSLSAQPAWVLEERYCGRPAAEKIEWLRRQMKEEGAQVHVLAALDDLAWLLNLRGNDVACNPVALCYGVVTREDFSLFINKAVLKEEVRTYLEGLGVRICPYEEVYQAVGRFREQKVLLESAQVNFALIKAVDLSNQKIERRNPTTLAKAIKNPAEVENMKQAHRKDGVAMVKFLIWLKENAGTGKLTEIAAAQYLDCLRLEQEGCLGPSFDTISAYGANGAMCHYKAKGEQNARLEPKGLYLVDSGGQYYEGTTDVTRTVALGELTSQEREHFTLTVIGMLRLGAVKFPSGCCGLNLDYAAREVFWSRGIDYDHGTGHGVGYLLNVHERPNSIRWRAAGGSPDNWVFEEGMVTSDEPGVYVEGSHGVRTENLLVCKKAEKNHYGQFMEFEFLTAVPIDLEALDRTLLTKRDLELLNNYHKKVYETLSPWLTKEEALWLAEQTREI